MATKRKDKDGRLLKKGERELSNDYGYEYRWTDRFGKRQSIYARDLDELRRQEADIELKNSLLPSNKDDLTLNQLYELWKSVKRGLKPNTFNNYKYMYEKYVLEDFGRSRVTDLKRSDFKRFYNSLYEKGMKPETIMNAHSVIHQMLDIALDDGIIKVNPADCALKELMSAHSRERKKVEALSHEEQTLLISYLYRSDTYRRYYPIFVTMMLTGLRVGEVTALQWKDIDFKKNTITVNKTLVNYRSMDDHKSRYAVHSTKTKAGTRIITMIGVVREALLMEERYQREHEILCRANIDRYDDFVFLNDKGNVYAQTTLNKVLKDIAAYCNKETQGSGKDSVLLSSIHCHMLRHTYGTRLNDAGVNVKAMQAMMGHSDYETTMMVYVDPSRSTMTKATENYQQLMNSIFSDTDDLSDLETSSSYVGSED